MAPDTALACSLGALLSEVRARLVRAGLETAALDARLIVEAATGFDHAAMIVRAETAVPAAARETALAMAARREAREPVFRILGWREFYGLRLSLSGGVLEPRPDTEVLVDLALPLLREVVRREGLADILDLGTGSGAIALALIAQVPAARAVGVDRSEDALSTARRNAADNGLAHRFVSMRSDWFAQVAGRYHLIVANPPYIPTEEIATLSPEVRRHDPAAALDGGADGLDAFRAIAGQAIDFLAANGHLIVEIGHGQSAAVREVFEHEGFRLNAAARDLGGHVRALHFVA